MWSSAQLDFSRRVPPRELPELMDCACSYADFRDCLHDLEQINRWLLGYRPTLAWLSHLPREQRKPIHVVDVGSGRGDLLRQIASWARARNIAVQLTGIDLNPYATKAAAEAATDGTAITWVTGDALTYTLDRPIDIVVSSLMTHHLEDHETVQLLRWMEGTARVGWFINDLKRSEWAYRSFGWLAKGLNWHRFVLHDGPVSFRRAFTESDWEYLLAAADVPRAAVSLKAWFPGRLCVGRWK